MYVAGRRIQGVPVHGEVARFVGRPCRAAQAGHRQRSWRRRQTNGKGSQAGRGDVQHVQLLANIAKLQPDFACVFPDLACVSPDLARVLADLASCELHPYGLVLGQTLLWAYVTHSHAGHQRSHAISKIPTLVLWCAHVLCSSCDTAHLVAQCMQRYVTIISIHNKPHAEQQDSLTGSNPGNAWRCCEWLAHDAPPAYDRRSIEV